MPLIVIEPDPLSEPNVCATPGRVTVPLSASCVLPDMLPLSVKVPPLLTETTLLAIEPAGPIISVPFLTAVKPE